jgi:outer membrane lipoprotein
MDAAMLLKRNDLIRLLTTLSALLVLTACASIPEPLAGDYADFQPEQATERSLGAEVRWGGSIVDTRPSQSETCLEILARDLDHSLRPISGDVSFGRFLACRNGFQDPAVFTQGRDVTVVGRLSAFTQDTIGEFVYRYPRLEASAIYLWPERPDVVYMDTGPYRSPWWPYMGPWWY